MKAPVMHLLVALVWLFLSGSATLGSFLLGLAAGFVLLALFQRALRCESYIRRICSFVVFIARILVDIVRSNLRITSLIVSKKAGALTGRFAYYDVSDLTDSEIIIMAQCLSLTPGTTVAERNQRGQLVLHTFPALTDDELKVMVDRTVKRPLLAFTR
jgi:multicomponent Na+:H+ antiporter subunit E